MQLLVIRTKIRRSKKKCFSIISSIIILISNYRQFLEFTVVFFFASANIITVGQRCLTIKEFERSRQNQAITLALSPSSNTNMVADITPACAEGGV